MVFRRAGFSPALSLLMSAFALLLPPATLTGHLRRLTERSPTQQRISVAAAASVHGTLTGHLRRLTERSPTQQHTVSLPQLRCMV
ncbi:hypothetical protein DXN21_24910 [Salmonella enterica subsp. enterica serovar Enteritidis]|nr:hypothetical protein DXN21_24910 [Salmonella enterica subsp. enterica serovar Enteritidis]